MHELRVEPLIVGATSIVLGVVLAAGAPDQTSSVTSGGGAWSSNAVQRAVSCAGQSGTTGVSRNSRYTHYAGFIGGSFIQPGTTNAHGVALEADPDNDDDGLTDTDEVSGAAFQGYATTDPNSADSDGDGMSDADEASGMYDPNDPGHSLSIFGLQRNVGEPESFTLTWTGKGGGTFNTILWTDDLLSGPPTNVLYSAPFSGGVAPWYKAIHQHTWLASGATNRFFGLKTE